jgi:hypothetical protein
MTRVVSGILLALVVLSVASGCAGGDTSLYVKNDSQQSWYLSVSREDGPDDYLWVVRVEPGADAFALSWDGGDAVPVSVLALDCSPVGTFRRSADGTWVVDAVPGLTGRIEPHGAPLGSRTTTPGVDDTEDCGGFVFR